GLDARADRADRRGGGRARRRRPPPRALALDRRDDALRGAEHRRRAARGRRHQAAPPPARAGARLGPTGALLAPAPGCNCRCIGRAGGGIGVTIPTRPGCGEAARGRTETWTPLAEITSPERTMS